MVCLNSSSVRGLRGGTAARCASSSRNFDFICTATEYPSGNRLLRRISGSLDADCFLALAPPAGEPFFLSAAASALATALSVLDLRSVDVDVDDTRSSLSFGGGVAIA